MIEKEATTPEVQKQVEDALVEARDALWGFFGWDL